jgi:hypothetical protein
MTSRSCPHQALSRERRLLTSRPHRPVLDLKFLPEIARVVSNSRATSLVGMLRHFTQNLRFQSLHGRTISVLLPIYLELSAHVKANAAAIYTAHRQLPLKSCMHSGMQRPPSAITRLNALLASREHLSTLGHSHPTTCFSPLHGRNLGNH